MENQSLMEHKANYVTFLYETVLNMYKNFTLGGKIFLKKL